MKKQKQVNERFTKAALQLYSKGLAKKEFESKYNQLKKKAYAILSESFDELGDPKTIEIDVDGDLGLRVNKVVRQNITFDKDAIKENLSHKLAEQIVSKTYTIYDTESFLSYMKELGANPKRLKSYLEPTEKVDLVMLEQLERSGDVSLEDLEGCYTIEESDPYFKINKLGEK